MKKISQSELVIMDILWTEAPMGASEIAEKVSSEAWNIRTIKTLLSRLVQKNILGTEPEGRRYLYRPLISKDNYGARVLDTVSQQFFKDRAAPLFLHLMKSQNLSPQDIDEISALLKDMKDQGGDPS